MAKKQALIDTVRGEVVASVDGHFLLVKTSRSRTLPKVPEGESARVLAAAGRALARPGISRASVFGTGLDPKDPTRFIREAEDGTRRLGRMVNGKFKVLAAA